MMIALKTIHTSFSPTKLAFVYTARLSKKNSTLCLCKSLDADDASPPEGDIRQQELLARIALLQTQKVRLTDYLDDRSAYLTQFAKEVDAEFDQIGENAIKELDEAGNRIMENIKSKMEAFEESAEMSRMGTQKKEEYADFEGETERDRNEGMFFKSLGHKAPQEKAKGEEEVKKIKELTKETAGSKTRRKIYLSLMSMLAIGIGDALISSSDWRKAVILGVIWVALLTQFIYEQRISSEAETMRNEKVEEEKK